MIRSAIERQFDVVSQALNRLRRIDPDTAAHIPDLARIVAFRNVLAHGYAVIDDALLWQFATGRLQTLKTTLEQLLA